MIDCSVRVCVSMTGLFLRTRDRGIFRFQVDQGAERLLGGCASEPGAVPCA